MFIANSSVFVARMLAANKSATQMFYSVNVNPLVESVVFQQYVLICLFSVNIMLMYKAFKTVC